MRSRERRAGGICRDPERSRGFDAAFNVTGGNWRERRGVRLTPLFEFPVTTLLRRPLPPPPSLLQPAVTPERRSALGGPALISIFIEMLSKPLRETHGNQWRLGSAPPRRQLPPPPHGAPAVLFVSSPFAFIPPEKRGSESLLHNFPSPKKKV